MGYTVQIAETVRRVRSVYIEDAESPAEAAELAEGGHGETEPGAHEVTESREAFRVKDDAGEGVPESEWRGPA